MIKGKSLSQLAYEFIAYKKSNGYVYSNAEYYLKLYINHVSTVEGADENLPTKENVNSMLNKYIEVPGSLYNLSAVLREFSRYLIGRGNLDAYLIPKKRIPQPKPEPPYFFTDNEIRLFFEECDNIKPLKTYPGRELILPALFRMLYCCGLRCKEARTLKCNDVHLKSRYFDIVQSKGPKNRRIFISHELADYLSDYDAKISDKFPTREVFFPNRYGYPYTKEMVSKNFKRIWHQAFPETINSGIMIRAYDFRHHLAYSNLNRWAHEGKDVTAMLPYLMRYMGHSSIKRTLYYFHLVPDFYGTLLEKSILLEDLIPEVPDEEDI